MNMGQFATRVILTGVVAWMASAGAGRAQTPQEPRMGPAPRFTDSRQLEAATPATPQRVFDTASVPAIDPFSRAAVVALYNNTYLPARNVVNDWNGSVNPCNAGATSAAYADATMTAVNYFRAMVRLPSAVTRGTDQDTKAQAAALMMQANNLLDHNPPATWLCFTPAGLEGAQKSNLALGGGAPGILAGAQAVEAYIDDGLGDLGHRRWVIFPSQTVMGVGNTSNANALWSLGPFGARPATPEFVTWPNAGFVPYQLDRSRGGGPSQSIPSKRTPRRSTDTVDVTNAVVTMTRGGTNVALTVATIQQGYGDKAIAWDPQITGLQAGMADQAYTVTIQNVLVNGVARTYNYNVTIIDPVPAAANTAPTITDITNQTVSANTPTSALAFTVGDTQTAAASLTLAGASSNTALVPNASIVFGGSGASRTVTVTPAANQTGTATITATVTDAGGLTASDTFVLTVTPPGNTAPTITDITNQTIGANTPTTALAFTVGDAQTAAASLTLAGASSNTALVRNASIVFGGSGASRTVTVTPAANQTGTATITVTVTDGGGLTASDTFVVTVSTAPTMTTYYLAEGATGPFWDLDLAIANPNAVSAPITITFLKGDATTVLYNATLRPNSRTTIPVETIAGLQNTATSAVVTSTTGLPLVVERSMFWNAGYYGSHGGTAVSGPATKWYFAEGSQTIFDTYVLLANANTTAGTATVQFLVEDPPSVVTRTVALLPTSRTNVVAGEVPELRGKSFSIVVDATVPIIAERAMYFGPNWAGGHESIGVTAPATSWFLAEGATGALFDTYVLVGNPNATPANVTLTYLLPSGQTIVRPKVMPANSRLTVPVELEAPALADTAVSTTVTADVPIIVERAMYWPSAAWGEAHNSFGVTETALKWGLAEGRVGFPQAFFTYILLANPNAIAAQVRVTFLRTNGTTVTRDYTVEATSRRNMAVNSDVPELQNEHFSAVIEVLNGQPIAVERAMYNNDAAGTFWAAGTNATAVRLP